VTRLVGLGAAADATELARAPGPRSEPARERSFRQDLGQASAAGPHDAAARRDAAAQREAQREDDARRQAQRDDRDATAGATAPRTVAVATPASPRQRPDAAADVPRGPGDQAARATTPRTAAPHRGDATAAPTNPARPAEGAPQGDATVDAPSPGPGRSADAAAPPGVAGVVVQLEPDGTDGAVGADVATSTQTDAGLVDVISQAMAEAQTDGRGSAAATSATEPAPGGPGVAPAGAAAAATTATTEASDDDDRGSEGEHGADVGAGLPGGDRAEATAADRPGPVAAGPERASDRAAAAAAPRPDPGLAAADAADRAAARAEVAEAGASTRGGRAHVVVGDDDSRVVVSIQVRGHDVDVTMRAGSDGLAGALGRSLDQLDAALRGHGLTLANVTTSSRDAGGGGRDAPPQPERPPAGPGRPSHGEAAASPGPAPTDPRVIALA
nr:hypothetical protein [Kofleriaceae bacterium]